MNDAPWKFWLSLWLGLATLLMTVIITCTALCKYNERRMAELGYEETTIPGHTCTVWQRVKTND